MSVRELMQRGSNVPSRRSVFDPFQALQEEVNRLFGELPTSRSVNAPATYQEAAGYASLDVTESDKAYTVTAEVPGMDPSDIELSVNGQYLTLSGEKRTETEDKNDNFLRRERSYGSFQRTIALPDFANMDEVDASYDKGVLTITVPKKAESVKENRRIDIQHAA